MSGFGGVNRIVFDKAKKLYRVAFSGAFLSTSTRALDLLTYRQGGSNEVEEHFPALDGTDVPELKDELHYGDIVWHSFETDAKPHAKALRFKRADFKADKFGHHQKLGAMLGRHLRVSQRKRAVEYLVKGFTDTLGTTYDGQTLFDTTHVTANGQTWSNAHDLALTAANFDIVYAALISAPMPDGDQLFESFDGELAVHLIAGPELKAAADAIVQPTLASGATNPRANRAKVVTLSDLRAGGDFDAYSDHWFLQATQESEGEMRPLTLLEHEQPELEFNFDGEDAFEKDLYKVRVRGDYGLGYRAPWAIQGSSGGA
jgi:Mu-like prophage major head subunit gpT